MRKINYSTRNSNKMPTRESFKLDTLLCDKLLAGLSILKQKHHKRFFLFMPTTFTLQVQSHKQEFVFACF